MRTGRRTRTVGRALTVSDTADCALRTQAGLLHNHGFRPNRQQLSILCARTSRYDPSISIQVVWFVRRTPRLRQSGATNRVGGGCHDNHKDHRNIDRRIGAPDHVRARRRHRPQGADEAGRAAAAVRATSPSAAGSRATTTSAAFRRPTRARASTPMSSRAARSPERRALCRHLGLEHQAADRRRPANSTSTAASARPSARSPSISAFMYYYYPRRDAAVLRPTGPDDGQPDATSASARLTLRDTDMWEVYGKATWTVDRLARARRLTSTTRRTG